MNQIRRAEKSEVQNLIYGDNSGVSKNYMRQNYEELKQIQKETQMKIQQSQEVKPDNWKMKKFRDVKSKLNNTGTIKNDENTKEMPTKKIVEEKPAKHVRANTQDKKRMTDFDSLPKMTKAEKMRMVQNRPLAEKNTNAKPPAAAVKRKSTLQSAGRDMVESKAKPTTNYKIGANNPPPAEIPNIGKLFFCIFKIQIYSLLHT